MRLSALKIHNYRSIRDLNMKCSSLAVLLGPNNHGKSNILSAIEFALSTAIRPNETDFYAFKDHEDDSLWVELSFCDLTEQEKTTFAKYLRTDSTFTVRKSARKTSAGVEISYNGYIQQPQEWWLRSSSDNVSRLVSREELNVTPLRDMVPPTGKLLQTTVKEAQRQYIEQRISDLHFDEVLETESFLGQRNVGGGVLPEFVLIPAVRDLAEEIKVKNTSAFGRLLNRAVKEMAEKDIRFSNLRTDLQNLVNGLNRSVGGKTERPHQLCALENTLQSELATWGVEVEIEIVPPVVEKIFELGTNLHLDDGVRTLAEQKGHGLQRAVIFALVRAWANALREPNSEEKKGSRASSESVIFAIEEPELFLHPHAQRRLARAIREIANSPGHQVFLCSHSTHFVDLDYYKNICIVQKSHSKTGTVIRQCTQDLFEDNQKKRFNMAHWVNPDRGEMFFSRQVIFVEGETEAVLLPYIANQLGCYDEEVSIVDCGSKNNLPLYISIANAFCLKYVVIHDEDPVPTDCKPEKQDAMQRTYALNEKIRDALDSSFGAVHIFSPDFEGVAGVPKRQIEKKGKPLAALNHLEDMPPESIPTRLIDVVRSIYTTSETQHENQGATMAN